MASFPDRKTKSVRAALDRLEARKTVLLVDNGENRNLTLGSPEPGRGEAASQPRGERL